MCDPNSESDYVESDTDESSSTDLGTLKDTIDNNGDPLGYPLDGGEGLIISTPPLTMSEDEKEKPAPLHLPCTVDSMTACTCDVPDESV